MYQIYIYIYIYIIISNSEYYTIKNTAQGFYSPIIINMSASTKTVGSQKDHN